MVFCCGLPQSALLNISKTKRDVTRQYRIIRRVPSGSLNDDYPQFRSTHHQDTTCYLGLQQLIANHPDEVRTHFHWVRDHGNKTFTEYRIAIAELKRLDQK